MLRFTLLLLLSVSLFAQSPFTPKDILSLEQPASPVISPDGKSVLFTIRKPDFNSSTSSTGIYRMDTETAEYHRFSAEGKNSSSPGFSPDGRFISFLSSRNYKDHSSGTMEDGASQLWLCRTDGGEAFNLTSLPNGVDEYQWSKKGNIVAVLSDKYDEKAEKELAAKKKAKRDEIVYPKANPVKTLHFISVPDGKILGSYDLDPGAQSISIHPDGDKVVYQSNLTGDYNDDQKFDIYIIDIKGNKKQLTNFPGPETDPKFSPDGNSIAYKAATVPDIEFAEIDLWVIGADGKFPKNLTKDINRGVSQYRWRDNKSIYTIINRGVYQSVLMIDPLSGDIATIEEKNVSVSDITFSSDYKVCWKNESDTSLAEIFVHGEPVAKKMVFTPQLKKFEKQSQEVITYQSKDGLFLIEGIIFYPAKYKKGTRYPLALIVHGGPYGHFRNVFNQSYPVRTLLSEGYVVFAPNPRGSSGYSDLFGQANRYDLGGGDYQDIMAGVDELIKRGIVDSTRMAVMGGSYGGYLTNWIISQNNRFKAAVSLYGIYSFLTDWSNSWQPAFEKMYFGYYYWEKPIDMNNLYISRSPAFYTQKIKTPTLILQGEKDLYTDIANSREMYQALRTIGTPVEFVVYPREGHGIRNEPNHYLDVLERTVNWVKKYCK